MVRWGGKIERILCDNYRQERSQSRTIESSGQIETYVIYQSPSRSRFGVSETRTLWCTVRVDADWLMSDAVPLGPDISCVDFFVAGNIL